MNQPPRTTALIAAGAAASGIGAMYADRLARRGHDLILVGRDPARPHAVDAAEDVEIPSPPERADWDDFTAPRVRLGPNLSRRRAAGRSRSETVREEARRWTA